MRRSGWWPDSRALQRRIRAHFGRTHPGRGLAGGLRRRNPCPDHQSGRRLDSLQPIPPIPRRDPASATGIGDAPPLRVGVIGLGFGADVHIPALRHLPETELIAVCSKRPEHAHLVAAQHVVQHVTTDYRNLINHPDVDAVIVAADNTVRISKGLQGKVEILHPPTDGP